MSHVTWTPLSRSQGRGHIVAASRTVYLPTNQIHNIFLATLLLTVNNTRRLLRFTFFTCLICGISVQFAPSYYKSLLVSIIGADDIVWWL